MSLRERFNLFFNPPNITLMEEKLTQTQTQLAGLSSTIDVFNERKLAQRLMKDNAANSHKNRMILAGIYDKSYRVKYDICIEVDGIKNSYMYNAIMEQLIGDAVAQNISSNDIVKLTSKNPKILKHLKQLEEVLDIDAIASSFKEDLLGYGEYYLKINSKKGKGVLSVEDNLEQHNIVAMYKAIPPVPSYFLKMKKDKYKTELVKIPAHEYAHFILGSRKLRVLVDGEAEQSEYVRIGRSIFFGVFEQIASLQLMSALIPASFVQKLNNTSIISLSVPEGMSVKDITEYTAKVEELLNSKISINSSDGNINISDVINATGRFKVIPVSSTDKGGMQRADPRWDEMDDPGILEDFRKTICSTVGVPYSFVFGQDGSNKSDDLRQFSRYVRKLQGIQEAISGGLRQICLVHLNQLGIFPNWDDIEINFTNTMASVEEIDRIEFFNIVVTSVGDIIDRISDVSERVNGEIDGDILNEFTNRFLKVVNLENVIKIPKDVTPDEEDEEDIEPEEEPAVEDEAPEDEEDIEDEDIENEEEDDEEPDDKDTK